MGSSEANIAQAREQAAGSARSAVKSEIEALVLARMEAAGGNLAQVARFRSFMGEALGVFGTVTDIIDMAVAGYDAMTTPTRMMQRVSAAHGFGYWIFQHLGIPSPLNPPNSFLVMHRERDRSDQSVGRRIDNPDYSTDGGLTAADWNSNWRRGVQDSFRNLGTRMHNMVRTGQIQRALQERLSRNAVHGQSYADVHGQSYEALSSQYRVLLLAPRFGSPAAAAGGFFLSSLRNAARMEKEANLRLYRQFPYNPR